MRRLFWLGVGLALGALIFRKMSKAAQHFTPGGLGRNLGNTVSEFFEVVRDFAADVREGMAEHEAALREGAELDGGHLGRTAP